MPLMGKHIDCGIYACVPYFFLVMGMHHAGLINSIETVQFLSFGITALIIGSDLPDIDAKKAPVRGLLAVAIFGAVFIGSVKFYKLSHLLAGSLATGSVLTYEKKMPKHRGFMHTVRAGLLLGLVLSVISLNLGASLTLAIWVGFSLFVGCLVHLSADRHLKL